MQQIVTKGAVGQTSLAIVAVVLVLNVVMPYVKGDDESTAQLTGVHLAEAVEPLKECLSDLESMNENQATSDIANADAHRRLTEALIAMGGSIDRLIVVVDRIERRVEKLNP